MPTHNLPTWFNMVLFLLVSIAAFTDATSRRIPNWLTGGGILCAIVLHVIAEGGLGIKLSVSGMIVAFSVYFALYCLRAMGAGDVKLMAAVGAFVGVSNWLVIFCGTAIVGAVAALIVSIRTKRLQLTLLNVYYMLSELAHFRMPFQRHADLNVRAPGALTLPHGLSIASGTIVYLAIAYSRSIPN